MGTAKTLATTQRRSGVLVVVAVLIAGVLVSALAAEEARQSEQRYVDQVMDSHADLVSTSISDRFARYGETLSDAADAIGAQSRLERADFDQIASGLSTSRLPGASGVAFVVPASTEQITRQQARWRSQGDPGLRLVPFGTSEHYFVIFEKVFDGTTTKGMDLARSPAVVTALRTARNSDSLALSTPFPLQRDRQSLPGQQQPAVLFAAPVHRIDSSAPGQFEGWLVTAVRGGEFMSQALRNDIADSVALNMTDEATSSDLVSAPAGATRQELSLLRERTLSIGQRFWNLGITPTEKLLSTTNGHTEAITLGVGLVLTIMLTILTAVLTGSRNRALQQVDRATATLRDDIRRREEVENQLRKREEQLHHLAHHDPLTGIANRALFHQRVTTAFQEHDESETTLAVLFVDLDGFKQINDQHGHKAGDVVLRETSNRIARCLRAHDTVARLGGDEFAVILERLPTAADARAVARRIVDVVRRPIAFGDDTVRVTASVGIATRDGHHDADSIIRDADMAMYIAKKNGKCRFEEAVPPRSTTDDHPIADRAESPR